MGFSHVSTGISWEYHGNITGISWGYMYIYIRIHMCVYIYIYEGHIL